MDHSQRGSGFIPLDTGNNWRYGAQNSIDNWRDGAQENSGSNWTNGAQEGRGRWRGKGRGFSKGARSRRYFEESDMSAEADLSRAGMGRDRGRGQLKK